MCRRADGSDLVKILDFGIARSRGDSRLTNAGELFGTPQYLAPERIMGGDTGPSVDLYALGVIFFEMATGKLPFEASDPTTFLIKHMKERPPAPRELEKSVPPELDALVVQLLEKDPKARPVDAHRIELDLLALARSAKLSVPPEPEDDPSSSRAPARTLPAVVIEVWTKRLEVFRRMLERSSDGGRQGLDAVLGEIGKLVREFSEVRATASTEQRKLEEIDARGRDGRQRFGFAVDALGLDSSKAKDELRGAQAALEGVTQEAKQAAEAYLAAQREAVTWEGRSGLQEPYPQLALAYRRCAEAVDAWVGARTKERDARASVESRGRTLSDLDYQNRPAPRGPRQPRAGPRPRPRRRSEARFRAQRARRAHRGAANQGCDAVLRAAPDQTRARSPFSAARIRGHGELGLV